MVGRVSPRILLVGHGRAGKDTGLEYLSALTGMQNAGSTSLYLTKYVAQRLGLDEREAYRTRHEMRDEWYRIGNELRTNDPGILLREALNRGPLTAGIRDLQEVVFARVNRVVDLIVWIENNRVPVDPTIKFGPEYADIVVQNNGSVEDYHERLKRLAIFAGLC